MKRDKAYYSKNKIRNLIMAGKISISRDALIDAFRDFGWRKDDICKAIMALPPRCCYESKSRFNNSQVCVDYYRAHNLKGEEVYTHFYVDDDILIIDSFKRI